MQIRTARLVLRPFRSADEEPLAHEADDRRVWAALRDRFPHPYDREAAREWIRSQAGREPPANLAITLRESGALLGGVGLERHPDVVRFTAEVGYWIGTSHWGHGYATEAVAAFVDYVFASFDVERVEAWIFANNERSMRVLEKCGFRLEGTARRSVFKEGRFLDSCLFGRLRDDPPAPLA